jgi:hypothetical protein
MRHRASLVAIAALAVTLAAPLSAEASLVLLRPDPLVSGTFYGHGGLSTDGWAGSGTGSLQADIPTGSSIYRAWLYAASTPSGTLASSVSFGGQSVSMVTINNDNGGRVTRGEVTSIVSAALASPSTPYSFAVTKPSGTEGVALAVIYSNPSEPNRTIALLDGGALPAGESATFSFASAIDPTTAGFEATLALGIAFSYQGSIGSHNCGTGQVSNVDINGTRLTSCAGSADDSAAGGGLITVGGVGDSTDNPPTPGGSGGNDDELYNLVPLLHAGDTALTVSTVNPSNDDYIFLAGITITARASVASTGSPTISTIADQAINAGSSTSALPFTVGDVVTAPSALVVTASSSDQTLVPDANITLGGSGAARTATVTAAAGQTGTATIYLTVTDGDANSSVSSFDVVISAPSPPAGPVNHAPVAVADTAGAARSDAPAATSIDVLANDTDVDGDHLAITAVSAPAHGSATIVGGHVEYTPAAGYGGDDSFTYTISDGSLTATATVTVTVAPDVQGPSLQAPTQVFVTPSTAARTATLVSFSWSAATDPSEVVSYEAQLSTDGGGFVAIGGPSMARTVNAKLDVGHGYQLEIRATDGIGNVSAWTIGPRFTVGARQTPAFTYTKHWVIIEAGTSAGTGFRYSTARGATASITLIGRSFAWVAPRNQRSGKAAVYVDGQYVATVNLHAMSPVSRRIVFAIAFSGRGTHTLTIRNLGTVGHARVSLDAVMILR